MKNIVLTGSAGFVGSWIAEKALAAGYHVIGIDNLSSSVDYTQKEVEFYKADVNDDIQSILQKADAIVHCAARAELRHNWEHKSQRDILFTNNEMATRSVLEQMPDVPFVFLSTCAIYGSLSTQKTIPLTEKDADPEAVNSPYGASKLACEAYIAAWAFKKQIPWYSLRLANQVGARTHRGVISDFAQMVREKGSIHAADSGEQKKSWVSVEDTAEAVIRMLDQSNPVPSGVYNITSDERWSWRDIYRIMNETSKEPIKLTFENKLAGSIGDPIGLHISKEKLKPYYDCKRSVDQAVREALNSIGWGK